MKRTFAAVGLAAMLAGGAVAGLAYAAGPSAAVTAAVADAARPEADKAKDADRKPAELLEFMGVKPGQTVMDFWPGSGYWSRLFSKAVGPKGHVYAYVPAEIAGMKSDPVAQAKALTATYPNVEGISDPLTSPPPKEALNSLDLVWTFENYHDLYNPFMKGADVGVFNKQIYAMLKPGGHYIIGDHAAPAGAGLTVTNTTHRIDPATVRAEVEKAGFKYVGELKVLANPDDPKTAGVFDASIRGKTDRFVLKFVKPR